MSRHEKLQSEVMITTYSENITIQKLNGEVTMTEGTMRLRWRIKGKLQ